MKKTIVIEGMSCMHCKMRVEHALRAVPGVATATVDLKKGRAEVDATGVVDATLLDAVRRAGYDPKRIEG